MRLLAALPRDRQKPGVLWIIGDARFTPARCRGEADNAAATAHGNPSEDPTLPYGDHPYGLYEVVAVERNKGARFGPAFLRLDPVDVPDDSEAERGEKNGRTGIGLHGGPLMPDGTLRATHGCLRVDDDIAAELADMIDATFKGRGRVLYECVPLREGA